MSHETKSKLVVFLYDVFRCGGLSKAIFDIMRGIGTLKAGETFTLEEPELAQLAERWARELGGETERKEKAEQQAESSQWDVDFRKFFDEPSPQIVSREFLATNLIAARKEIKRLSDECDSIEKGHGRMLRTLRSVRKALKTPEATPIVDHAKSITEEVETLRNGIVVPLLSSGEMQAEQLKQISTLQGERDRYKAEFDNSEGCIRVHEATIIEQGEEIKELKSELARHDN